MQSAAQRSITALRYSRELSQAFLARSRADAVDPVRVTFNIGDQVFYWRGVGQKQSAWAERWHGPAVIIGFEANNVWVSHRGTTLKCAARHVRAALPEEQIPWGDIMAEAARNQPETPYVGPFPAWRPS